MEGIFFDKQNGPRNFNWARNTYEKQKVLVRYKKNTDETQEKYLWGAKNTYEAQ